MLLETGNTNPLADLMTASATESLYDPATQAALGDALAAALETPAVRRAVRPYFMEGAAWAAVALFGAIFVWRIIR
jgi:hypothetical protein